MSGLQHLLEQATRGNWFVDRQEAEPLRVLADDERRTIITVLTGSAENPYSKAEASLIALAPDMARLLIDMADWISGPIGGAAHDEARALLARFAELDRRAAQ